MLEVVYKLEMEMDGRIKDVNRKMTKIITKQS